MKKANGYKIDFTTNTITMNYKFAAAAGVVGSAEYNIIKQIRIDFPGMTEIVQSGRTQKTARPNKRLTYANMKLHIEAYENSKELLEVFETVKALSKPLASPYQYVADWFTTQFPDYQKTPIFKDGKLTIAPVAIPKITEYKKKIAA